jgi:hypothetical protein
MANPESSSPLSDKVRNRKQGFLNRTLEGKKIRESHPLCGGKRQKKGGTHSRLNRVIPREPLRGSYVGPVTIPDALRNLKQQPISEHAKEILSEYIRRQVFWHLVEDHGMTIGFAGKTILRVQERRAAEVFKELKEADGPLRWFRLKAIKGLRSGKIAPGRMTAWCEDADQFFKFLAGGKKCIEDIRFEALGGISEIPADRQYEGITKFEREILEYTVFKFLNKTRTRKGAKRE